LNRRGVPHHETLGVQRTGAGTLGRGGFTRGRGSEPSLTEGGKKNKEQRKHLRGCITNHCGGKEGKRNAKKKITTTVTNGPCVNDGTVVNR